MPKPSSTFSFRPFRSAVLWALAAVVVIEAALAFALPATFFSHEVDHILYDLDHKKYDSEFVLIGDSVGRQILGTVIKDDADPKAFAVLTSNAAIETAGQYYLIRRYLSRNRKPKAVIFVGRNPLDFDLDSAYTENFFQRCFLKFGEIAEAARYKGPEFGLVMTVYRLFPSYRYRLHLQKRIAGFANLDAGTGQAFNPPARSRAGSRALPAGRLTSEIFLDKLLQLCDRESIPFYFFAAPMPDPAVGRPADVRSYDETRNIWDALRRKHPGFHWIGDAAYFPEDAFRPDRIHLKLPAAMRAGKLWWEFFYRMLRQGPDAGAGAANAVSAAKLFG